MRWQLLGLLNDIMRDMQTAGSPGKWDCQRLCVYPLMGDVPGRVYSGGLAGKLCGHSIFPEFGWKMNDLSMQEGSEKNGGDNN